MMDNLLLRWAKWKIVLYIIVTMEIIENFVFPLYRTQLQNFLHVNMYIYLIPTTIILLAIHYFCFKKEYGNHIKTAPTGLKFLFLSRWFLFALEFVSVLVFFLVLFPIAFDIETPQLHNAIFQEIIYAYLGVQLYDFFLFWSIDKKLKGEKIDLRKLFLAKGYNNGNVIEQHENLETKIDYYKDISIKSQSEDQFKHIDYMEVLKDILLHSETPLNVGLYGRWGVGKSSILNMLKEQIESKLSQQFRYLYVDAWKLSPRTLKQEVLVELNTQLRTFTLSEIEDELYNAKQELYFDRKSIMKASWPIWIAIVGGILGYLLFGKETTKLLALIGVSSAISIIIALVQFIISPAKRIIPQAVSSHQFDELYKKMIEKEGRKKLAVVIDNLDRCSDEVAVELLGLIQSFMTKENCINILACDDEAIVNHLRRVKGESYTEREGNEFLSKFFQVTIRIPPFIPDNLATFVTGQMEKRQIKYHPSVKLVLISGAIKNPRKVNQFLNNLVALYRLAEQKEGSKSKSLPLHVITERTDFLTKAIILHHEWPKFYDELDKTHDIRLLDPTSAEFRTWFTNATNKPEQNEYEVEQFDGLADFLTDTRYCRVDDIKPFLRLNQPSYQGEIPDIEKFDQNVRNNRITPILDTLNKENEKGKENHVKIMRDINDEYEKVGSFAGLLNSTQALIGACDVISNPPTREIALMSLGKCISSELMKTHLSDYDIDRLFPLIREMREYYSEIIYQNFIQYVEAENVLNEKLVTRVLDNSPTIPRHILDDYDKIITTLSSKYEEKILEIIGRNCNSANWVENKFRKPIQFIISLINKINFDNSPLDNKRVEICQTIQKFIDITERDVFVKHLKEIVDRFTKANTLLPPKILEIIENWNEDFVRGVNISLDALFDSLTMTTTSIPDPNQRKRIFEVLFRLVEITKEDTS